MNVNSNHTFVIPVFGLCALLLLFNPSIEVSASQQVPPGSEIAVNTTPTRDQQQPPYRRILTGEDEERVSELEVQIADLRTQGRYAGAIPLANEILAIRLRVQGSDHWQTADARRLLRTLNRIILMPHDAQAELAKADASDARVKALTFDPKARLELFDLLGGVTSAQIRQELEVQLEIRRRVLGNDHPDTLRSIHLMGCLLVDQGTPLEADSFTREALEGRRRVLGNDHRDTLWSLVSMIRLSYWQGKYLQRGRFFHEALEGSRRVLGDGDCITLFAMHLMGMMYIDQGRYSEAEEILLEGLNGHRCLLGENHSKTLLNMCHLGKLYVNRGDISTAESIMREALARSRRELGDEDPATSTALYFMGWVFFNQGKLFEAEMMFREMAEVHRHSTGLGKTLHWQAIQDVSWVLAAQGKYAEAEPLLRDALDFSIRNEGDDNLWAYYSNGQLGQLLMAQGKLDGAEQVLRMAVENLRRSVGDDCRFTLDAINGLGRTLWHRGYIDEAEALFRELIERRRRMFGNEDADVVGCLNILAFLQAGKGELTAAEVLLTEAADSYEAVRIRVGSGGLERAQFAADMSPLEPLAACLVRNGKPLAGWERYEANLARGLLDAVSARTARPLNVDEHKREEDLIDQLNELEERIGSLLGTKETTEESHSQALKLRNERDTLQAELVAFELEMVAKYGAAAGEVFGLTRIQAELPEDTALLGWVDVEDPLNPTQFSEHWACLVRHEGEPVWVRLPGSGEGGAWTEADKELAMQLRQFLHQRSLGRSDRGREPLVQKLYAQRIAPVEPFLSGVDQLIILPAGRMAGVPVEALTENYTVSYAPSGTMYAWLAEKSQGTKKARAGEGRKPESLLALGDPVFRQPETKNTPLPTPPDHGVLVAMVTPESGAQRSGLRSGDVLLSYGEEKLERPADFTSAIDESQELTTPVDKPAALVTVWREGETLEIKVPPGNLGLKLDSRPAPEAIPAKRRMDAAMDLTRGPSFEPLPHTRHEVATIGSLFKAPDGRGKSMILLGSEASEQRLQALARSGELTKYRYLHLATHGVMDDRVAMQSALILSQDNLPDSLEQVLSKKEVYDGRLTGEQIVRTWKLDADLVTLSGCETALGKEAGGEGYLGFSQALFVAGARSLLLSLWNVNDRATMLLMKRFYENLLGRFEEDRQALNHKYGPGEPLPKAEALWEAKQWLRELTGEELQELDLNYSMSLARGAASMPGETNEPPASRPFADPHYWAAFILIGDPD